MEMLAVEQKIPVSPVSETFWQLLENMGMVNNFNSWFTSSIIWTVFLFLV